MFKKMVSIILCLIMAASAITASAASSDSAQSEVGTTSDTSNGDFSVFFAYTAVNQTTITIDSGTATCDAYLGGYAGITTSISITMTLQKKVLLWWNTVETWTMSVDDWSANLTRTHTGLGSGTYRVKAVYVVYSGSNSETITSYSPESTY